MPQKLLETPAGAAQSLKVSDRELLGAHEQITSILRSRLGQNHADLLAVPKVASNGSVGWNTALTGTVLRTDALPDAERAKLEQRAERILSEIRGLAQQLAAEGPTSQIVAQMLEQATRTPPGDWLYSVDGKPVLAMWGHAAIGSPQATFAAAPVAAAAAAATGGSGLPPPLPPGPDAPRPWKRWLVAALLALVLLALLFWAWKQWGAARSADAGLAAQIAEAETRNRTLEEELARKRGAAPEVQCKANAPPPAPEPASEPTPPPPPEPPPSAAAPDPLDALKQRVSAAGKDCKALGAMLKNEPLLKQRSNDAAALRQEIARTMAQHCRENLIREAKNLCPGERPAELAPEVVIVFDASGSMRYSLDVTEAQIRQAGEAAAAEQMMRMFGLGRPPSGSVLERLTREPTRLTTAKRAAVAVAQRIPSDMSVGLVLVDQCPASRSMGFFSPGQRGSLIGRLQGIEAMAGTPLGDGVARGGSMVDGRRREALMVVISDGVASCGEDPCAAAAALARAKPYLKINVVDITGTGAGNCLASATGGKVFTANTAKEVGSMVNRAVQEALGPANCRK